MSIMTTQYIQHEFRIGEDTVRPGMILRMKNYQTMRFQYLMTTGTGSTWIVGVMQNGRGGSVVVPIERLRGLFKPKRSRRHKTYV